MLGVLGRLVRELVEKALEVLVGGHTRQSAGGQEALQVDLESQEPKSPRQSQHGRARSLEQVPSLGEPASPRHCEGARGLLPFSWREDVDEDGARTLARPRFANELKPEETGKAKAASDLSTPQRYRHSRCHSDFAASPCRPLRIAPGEQRQYASHALEVDDVSDVDSDEESTFNDSGGPSTDTVIVRTSFPPKHPGPARCAAVASTANHAKMPAAPPPPALVSATGPSWPSH